MPKGNNVLEISQSLFEYGCPNAKVFFLEKQHKKVNLQFTDMIAGFFMRQQYR